MLYKTIPHCDFKEFTKVTSHLTFNCSKSTIETLEKGVKHVIIS